MAYDNLIFLHIPKAAGSTLHPVLERHYGRHARETISLPHQLESFKELPLEARRRIRLLKGHMPFGAHEYLSGPSRYITLLRHPVDRVVSLYYYAKRQPDHYLHHCIDKDERMSAFSLIGLSGEIHNGQVRLLSGHDQDITCGGCTSDMLETAKRNIEQHFAAVGLTERFDESLALISMALGWQTTPYYLSENVTQGRPRVQKLDTTTRRAIEHANVLDLELYEWVRTRFENQVSDHREEVEAWVARVRRANQLYRPWGTFIRGIKRNLKRHVPVPSRASP